MVRTVPDQAMDRVGIGMEGKEHRTVRREELCELLIRERLVVLLRILDLQELDDIHDTNLHAERIEKLGRSKRLLRRHVSAAPEHDVRLLARLGRGCPLPLGSALLELLAGIGKREPRRLGLFAGKDAIDTVRGLVAALCHREQHVRICRIVDVHYMVVVPALVEQDIHKARVLVGEAIVVLAPDMARKEHVEAGDRLSPGDVAHSCLEPLGMLVHHRVDDVDKGLVGRPQAMTTGEEIALEQAFALVLGELLDNIADRSHVLIVCRVVVEVAVEPLLIGHLVARLQAVRCRLVGTEDTEAVTVIVDELGRVLAEDTRRLGRAGTMSQPVHVEGIILRLRQLERLSDAAAIGIWVRADSELAFRHELGDLRTDGTLLREEA